MFLVSLPSVTGYRNINAHYSVLNFDNCVHHIAVATGTIEFRQHEGTLNHSDICACVELTAMLTQFCDNASARQIVSLCGHAWDHEFSVFHLMDTIGCRPELTNYYRLLRSPARHEAFDNVFAQDSAELAAGRYTGLQALRKHNELDKFHRRSPLGVNITSSQKLYAEAQGRRMHFNAGSLADMKNLFDAAANEAAAGRGACRARSIWRSLG